MKIHITVKTWLSMLKEDYTLLDIKKMISGRNGSPRRQRDDLWR